MGYRLQRLEVAGFRGINRQLSVALNAGLTVVLGRNGSGKSSLLQAVEWGLFGALQLGGVSEGRREDAIVNSFVTESRANVRIVLSDGTATVTVVRERRLGRSTTARSDLTVSAGGETWRDEQAATELRHRLGLTAGSFYTAVYLRQDAIGAAVGGTEEERAATIDRLLGMSYLRDLVEGVHQATVQREATRLERQIEQEEAAGLTTAINVRRLLAEREEQLRQRGVAPAQLSMAAVVQRLDGATATLSGAAGLLQVEEPTWPAAPAERLAAAQARLRTFRQHRAAALGELHRVHATVLERTERLRSLLEMATPISLADGARRRTVEAEIATLDRRIAALRAETDDLAGLAAEERAATAALGEAETRLSALSAEHGGAERVSAELVAVQADLARVTAEGRHKRLHAQLLNDAVEVLTAAPRTTCPVCGQSADQPALLRRLRTALQSDRDAHALEGLREQYRQLDERRRRLKDAQDAIARARTEIERQHAALVGVRQRATPAMEASPAEREATLQARLEQRRQALAEATQWQAALAAQQRALAAEASQERPQAAARALDGALIEAAKLTGTPTALDPASIDDLAVLLERAGDIGMALADRLAAVERTGADLDGVEADLRQVEAGLAYLDLQGSVERLEVAQPGVTERLQRLRSAHAEVAALAGGLERIRGAALAERQALLERSLAALLPLLNDYYRRLGGHPAFTSLSIQAEQVRGNPLYRLLASDASEEHTGFLPTRFSRTQRHVAALATFLALARRLPHNLDLLLLDDPAQSMDLDHQQALAALLTEEAHRRQVVVATEDDRFAAVLVETAGKSNGQVIELGAWSAAGTTVRSAG